MIRILTVLTSLSNAAYKTLYQFSGDIIAFRKWKRMNQKMYQYELAFLFLSILALVASLRTDIVITTKGPVRGEILTTIQNKIQYAAFNGIPYGKPPVGYLRFKPPVEIDAWNELFEATLHPPGCPQYGNGYLGDEDCLYLNIYTPKTAFNASIDNARAVMVWIHGGAFVSGAADSSYYGPDFFIEEDVVLVYIDYRLGALGFLSLNHPNATGNAGLKDQVLALKWIQKNIQNFGGDPKKITLFGQSAGSVAVELHGISDMSRGLFNRSIAMSGSPLNYWGFSPILVAQQRAFDLCAQLGTITLSKDVVLKTLYEASPADIILATQKMIQLDLPFKPTLEDTTVTKNAFLSECAFRAYRNGEFHLPHILGFEQSETLAFVPTMIANFEPSEAADKLLTERINIAKNAQDELNSQSAGELTIDLFKYYDQLWEQIMISERLAGRMAVDLRKLLIQEAVRVTTNLLFILGIDQTQQYRNKGSAPIWYYRNTFDYNASLHKINGIPLHGSAHADDIAEIFWMKNYSQTLDPKSDLSVQRRRMTRMWANFAKYGNPTPNGTADPLLNVTWSPSGARGIHLEISRQYKMGSRPIDMDVEMAEAVGMQLEKFLNGCYMI